MSPKSREESISRKECHVKWEIKIDDLTESHIFEEWQTQNPDWWAWRVGGRWKSKDGVWKQHFHKLDWEEGGDSIRAGEGCGWRTKEDFYFFFKKSLSLSLLNEKCLSVFKCWIERIIKEDEIGNMKKVLQVQRPSKKTRAPKHRWSCPAFHCRRASSLSITGENKERGDRCK